MATGTKITYEEIKKRFEDKGLTLITKEYKNAKTKMDFICLNGHLGSITPNSLANNSGCRECTKSKLSERFRLSYKRVEKEFVKAGYTLLSKEYVNDSTKLEYMCSEGHLGEMNYSNFRQGKRCPSCYLRSGEHHHNWNGGVTILATFLRGHLEDWRKQSLESTGNRCDITGENGELEVHHKYPFHKIYSTMLSDIKIDIRENMSLYSQEEKDIMKNGIKKRHNDLLGAPLLKEVHFLYHQVFGYENTEEQYDFFKANYKKFAEGKMNATDFNKYVAKGEKHYVI